MEFADRMTQPTPTPHPTVLGLWHANKRKKLSTYHLNRLIDAREQNLLSPSYNTLSDVTAYAQSTTLPLLLLSMSSILQPGQLKIDTTPLTAIDHALSHLATYITLSQLLRSIAYFASSKRTIVIPRDVGSAHGIVEESVYRALPALSSTSTPIPGSPSALALETAFPPVISACQELVELAEGERLRARWTLGLEESQDEEHATLAQGRKLSKLPKQLIPVFLNAVPAFNTLKEFKKIDCNPFNPGFNQPQSRNWRLPLQTAWAYYTRQF